MAKKFEGLSSPISNLELRPTVIHMMSDIMDTEPKIKFDYRLIGSSTNGGKRQLMGDIDVAVEESDINRSDLKARLVDIFDEESVATAGPLSLLYPIYDTYGNKTNRKVQVDFMFGNAAALQAMYFSPALDGIEAPANSPLKAKHKNMLIGDYCASFPEGEQEYKLKDDENRYKMVYKYKWAMLSGLQLVARNLCYDNDRAEWVRDKQDQVIFTLDELDAMAKVLVNANADWMALVSAENFLSQIAKYKGEEIAYNLLDQIESDPKMMKNWQQSELDYLRNYLNGIEAGKRTDGEQTIQE